MQDVRRLTPGLLGPCHNVHCFLSLYTTRHSYFSFEIPASVLISVIFIMIAMTIFSSHLESGRRGPRSGDTNDGICVGNILALPYLTSYRYYN